MRYCHAVISPRRRYYGTVFCSLTFLAGAAGQGIPEQLSELMRDRSPPASAVPPMGTTQLASVPALPRLPSNLVDETPFRWGPVKLRPHVLYRFSTSAGVQSRPGQTSDSAIQETSPGIALELGDRWTLDYTPTLRFYSNDAFQDTTDHAVNFSGGTQYRNWTLGLSQGYALSSQPLAETASQTEQESFTTMINAGYRLTTSLTLELGASQAFRFASQSGAGQALNDSRLWSSMNWLNYTLTDKWGVGLGGGGGYEEMGTSPNMTHEQIQGRINWRPSDKLSLSFNGGVEYRQFAGSGRPDAVNPIFGMTIQSPLELTRTTMFSLHANRTLSSSVLQDTLSVTTDFGATITQRLLQRLYLTVNAGYRITAYESTSPGGQETRDDRSMSYSARLSMNFLKRASAAVFYQASDNTSSQTGFSSSNQQAGVELSYRY